VNDLAKDYPQWKFGIVKNIAKTVKDNHSGMVDYPSSFAWLQLEG
jgi:hypothetical protein